VDRGLLAESKKEHLSSRVLTAGTTDYRTLLSLVRKSNLLSCSRILPHVLKFVFTLAEHIVTFICYLPWISYLVPL
jgi:hypothetical protein